MKTVSITALRDMTREVKMNVTFVDGVMRARIPGEWTNRSKRRVVFGPDGQVVTYANHWKIKDDPDAQKKPPA